MTEKKGKTLPRKIRNHKKYRERLKERGLMTAIVVVPTACYDKLKEIAKNMREGKKEVDLQ